MNMRYALLSAAFAAFNAAAAAQTPPELDPRIAPQRVAGAALNVVDIERSRAFYMNVLGLKQVARVPALGPVHEYLLSAGGSLDEGLIILTKVEAQTPEANGFGRLVLVVPDAAALARRSGAAGYVTNAGPGGTQFLRDPDGFLVELFQMPAAR